MKNIVDIKGTKHGLAIHINHNYNTEVIKNSLRKQFEKAKGFFEGAEFYFVTEKTIPQKVKEELEDICKEFGLYPKELTAARHNQINCAVINKKEGHIGLMPEELNEENKLIKGNVRSGQSISFSGNIILIGDVNPGGQIYASGSIIILGALRGIAHAGAEGNETAFVLAYDFKPHQVRIANKIARNPDTGLDTEITGPEVARLENEKVIIEKYKSCKKTQL